MVTRLFWAKQRLFRGSPPSQLVNVVGDICGLHAQFPLSPALSLWNRVRDFTPRLFEQKLNEEKELVKTWLMRGTVHIIPTRDFAVYHKAIQEQRLAAWNKFLSKSGSHHLLSQIEPLITKALSQGPLSREELHNRVPELRRIPGASWGLDIKGMCYEGKVVFAGRNGQHSRFALTHVWFDKSSPLKRVPSNARSVLVRRYLRAYGPATEQDYRYWSGLPARTVVQAFQSVRDDLETVSVGKSGTKMFLLKEDLETMDSVPDCVGIRLLPKYDPYVMGHFDKTRFLSQKYRRHVFRKAAIVEATVVLEGQVIGTWRYSTRVETLQLNLSLFRKISESKQDPLHKEANFLASMFGRKSASVDMHYHN